MLQVRVPERFAVAVMGCTGVGKSALVTKFIRRSHACVSFFLAHCHYAARVEGAYRIAFHARDEVLLEHDPTIEV